MRKILFLFCLFAFISIIFVSCSYKYDYNYYIINSCDEEIYVVLIDYEDKSLSFRINPQEEQLIFQGVGYNFASQFTIESFLKEITITKEDITSKVNYADNNFWGQKNKTQENFYLTIKSEDFE